MSVVCACKECYKACNIHSDRFLVLIRKELNFAESERESCLKKIKHHSIGKTCRDSTELER